MNSIHKNNPNAAIVGKLLADQRGLKIGDRLNSKSNYKNGEVKY